MLKYTPDHMHCLAVIYGPQCPPNTGFCAFQTLSDKLVRPPVLHHWQRRSLAVDTGGAAHGARI